MECRKCRVRNIDKENNNNNNKKMRRNLDDFHINRNLKQTQMMSRNLQRRGGVAVLAMVLNVIRTEFALASCGNVNK